METFKNYHNVDKDITLESKVENGKLFVYYNDQWCQLSQEKNTSKFYSYHVIQQKHGVGLCKELGLPTKNKYSKEHYAKYRHVYLKASKKYNAKMKAKTSQTNV